MLLLLDKLCVMCYYIGVRKKPHLFEERLVLNMARTALVYSTCSCEEWDEVKGKVVKHITSRGFDFFVRGCRTQREEIVYLDSFIEYLMSELGYDARGNFFGSGEEYTDTETGEIVEGTYLAIEVKDADEKDDVKACYDEWKREMFPNIKREFFADR